MRCCRSAPAADSRRRTSNGSADATPTWECSVAMDQLSARSLRANRGFDASAIELGARELFAIRVAPRRIVLGVLLAEVRVKRGRDFYAFCRRQRTDALE